MKEFKYEIKKHYATLSDDGTYRIELNAISFNGGPVKYDLRRWRDKDGQMLKGIGLTAEELAKLHGVLDAMKMEGGTDEP